MRPPRISGEGTELSRRVGECFADAMGDEPVAADTMLSILATWVAALINVHPSSREYLAAHFAEELAARLGGPLQ
jgi:hypothetical protein